MEMSGRCGFSWNCFWRFEGEMRSGQTPGKSRWKDFSRRWAGFSEMDSK